MFQIEFQSAIGIYLSDRKNDIGFRGDRMQFKLSGLVICYF